ncbi:MAG TPA: hypothetical protein VIJ87_21245, partial [Pyrinomonadaceae bacterium]
MGRTKLNNKDAWQQDNQTCESIFELSAQSQRPLLFLAAEDPAEKDIFIVSRTHQLPDSLFDTRTKV